MCSHVYKYFYDDILMLCVLSGDILMLCVLSVIFDNVYIIQNVLLASSRNVLRKKKFGHPYADGIAVGVRHLTDAQDRATSPQNDQMGSPGSKRVSGMWVPQSAYADGQPVAVD